MNNEFVNNFLLLFLTYGNRLRPLTQTRENSFASDSSVVIRSTGIRSPLIWNSQADKWRGGGLRRRSRRRRLCHRHFLHYHRRLLWLIIVIRWCISKWSQRLLELYWRVRATEEPSIEIVATESIRRTACNKAGKG